MLCYSMRARVRHEAVLSITATTHVNVSHVWGFNSRWLHTEYGADWKFRSDLLSDTAETASRVAKGVLSKEWKCETGLHINALKGSQSADQAWVLDETCIE